MCSAFNTLTCDDLLWTCTTVAFLLWPPVERWEEPMEVRWKFCRPDSQVKFARTPATTTLSWLWHGLRASSPRWAPNLPWHFSVQYAAVTVCGLYSAWYTSQDHHCSDRACFVWWSTDGDDKRGRLVFVKAHRVKKLVDYFTDLGNAATVQTKGNEQACTRRGTAAKDESGLCNLLLPRVMDRPWPWLWIPNWNRYSFFYFFFLQPINLWL